MATMMQNYNKLMRDFNLTETPLAVQVSELNLKAETLNDLNAALNAYAEPLGDKAPKWLAAAIKAIKWERSQAQTAANFITEFNDDIRTEINKKLYDETPTDNTFLPVDDE